MAVTKNHTIKSTLNKSINYATDKEKSSHSTGINCILDNAYLEMMTTKKEFGKDDRVLGRHIIQSFAPGETTAEEAHQIGIKLAESLKGYQVVIGTHVDKDHIHNHLVLNSVNAHFGYKYNATESQNESIRDMSDRLCEKYGLSVIKEPKERGKSMGEIKALERGDSWKASLTEIIQNAVYVSKNKTEFIDWLNKTGIDVKWTDGRKNISFKYRNKKKFIRDDTLGFSKESIEKDFGKHLEKQNIPSRIKTESQRENEKPKSKKAYNNEFERYELYSERREIKNIENTKEDEKVKNKTNEKKLIDKDLIQQARQVNLREFLSRKGYRLERDSRNNYRIQGFGGLIVTEEGKWYQHSTDQGGEAIDFLIRFENRSFKEAVEELTNISFTKTKTKEIQEEKKVLKLPKSSQNNDKLIFYLNKMRCISKNIIETLIKKGLIYQAENDSVAFVGRDKEGKIKCCFERGINTDFKKESDGSDKRYSFNIINQKKHTLNVFEGTIDLLSYMTFRERGKEELTDNYLSLGGLEDIALKQFLEDHKQIREINLFMDNDQKGKEKAVELKRKYDGLSYNCKIKIVTNAKDINEALQKTIKQQNQKEKGIKGFIDKANERKNEQTNKKKHKEIEKDFDLDR